MRIVISGTVGIGKSTISKKLVKELKNLDFKSTLLNEDTAKSIYLDSFYKKPAEWAFISQLDFLMERFKQWLSEEIKINKMDNDYKKNYYTIYDRHFLDDYVFAELHSIKNNISMYNSLTYHSVYKELLEKMNKFNAQPDYFILLTGDLEETILKRLVGRGRESEKEVDKKYWEDLYRNYYERPMFQNHFASNSRKFLKIDTNDKTPDQLVKEILAIITK